MRFPRDLGGMALAHSKAHLSPLVLRLARYACFYRAARFAKSNSPRRSGKIRALSPSRDKISRKFCFLM